MNNGATVLVVDDDKVVADLLDSFLQQEGYRVALARDGVSALSLLEVCSPDLILLDIFMPRLNGIALLKAVRQQSRVPIIMVSGICEPSFMRKALADGANNFISKPFKLPALKDCIEAELKKAGVRATGSDN